MLLSGINIKLILRRFMAKAKKISPYFRVLADLQVNISRRRQARQLTGGGGVLLHAQRSEHVKGHSRQDPTCGLSATGLAAAGNINNVWVKILTRHYRK